MKIKDSFWLGLLVGIASCVLTFLPLYYFVNWNSLGIFGNRAPFLLAFIPDYFVNWNSLGIFGNRAPFLLAFIPGVVLFRMMLVKWNLEKMGKGILAITVVGMLLVFFLVKSTNG